jgi:hypothetical protein
MAARMASGTSAPTSAAYEQGASAGERARDGHAEILPPVRPQRHSCCAVRKPRPDTVHTGLADGD